MLAQCNFPLLAGHASDNSVMCNLHEQMFRSCQLKILCAIHVLEAPRILFILLMTFFPVVMVTALILVSDTPHGWYRLGIYSNGRSRQAFCE